MSRPSVKRMSSGAPAEQAQGVDWASVARRVEEPLRQFTRSGASGAQASKNRQLSRTALHEFRQTMELIEEEVEAEREDRDLRRQRESEAREERGDLKRWLAEKDEVRKDVLLAVETTERLARSDEIAKAQRFWRRITSLAVGATIALATVSAINGEPMYFAASGFGLAGSVGSAVVLRRSTPLPREEDSGGTHAAG